jgi:hypothetical protein
MFAVNSTTAELSSLQQQVDSFLLKPAASAKGSVVSEPTEQLAELFSSAPAQDSQGQLRDVDAALSQNFAAWLQQIAVLRVKGADQTAADRQVWLAAAIAQWRILQEASSPAAAQALMGIAPVPEPYLRCEHQCLTRNSVQLKIQQFVQCSLIDLTAKLLSARTW